MKLMEVMLAKKKKMSQLTEGLTIYPQELQNIRVRSKEETLQDPAVQAAVEAVSKELGTSGRLLVRQSGTEPVIRVMAEASDEGVCKQAVARVVETIRSCGYEVK